MSTGWSDPVDWITAGVIGEPGARTFFLQASHDGEVLTLLLEKEQLDALSRHIHALLIQLGEAADLTTEAASAPELADFDEPLFRVGQMSLGVDTDRDAILLQVDEFVMAPDDEDEDDGDDEEDEDESDWTVADLFADPEVGRVRMWATRAQMRALADVASLSVSGGRPRCEFCGQPIDAADGEHLCVAMNGHRKVTGID